MRMGRWVLVATLAVSGCASSRASLPDFPEAGSAYSFQGLKPGLRVEALDQRTEDAGDGTAEALGRGVAGVLARSGVPVSPDAPLLLEIRLTQYRSDFSLGNWRGCTGLVATLRGLRDEPVRIPVDRCVTRANTFGFRSAGEASQASFNDAVAALLTELDLL